MILISLVKTRSVPTAEFPLQFSANIVITSHLIDVSSEYPPRTRSITVYYDYIQKRARAEIEAGYEAAKYYIRRYDQKNEYMIRLPPIDDCKRSYLGETMPFPDISAALFIKQETINKIKCYYFLFEDFNTRVHIYLSIATKGKASVPVRLIEEDFQNGESTPLLTYDYSEVSIGPPAELWFELPQGRDHKSCDRHVGGFPYLHIFHYFVRF
jgi:hypothetical protein